jgi:S1-C subfamily serine protease
MLLMSLPLVGPAVAGAQEFTVTRAAGAVLVLADGRQAVIGPTDRGLAVKGLIEGSGKGGAPVDLAVGDLIVTFQGKSSGSADELVTAYERLPVGARVTMVVRRGDVERTVTFERPALPAGKRMAVAMQGSAGAGAWTTGGGPSDVTEIVIAGAHIRNNADGLPAVSHRTADPAEAVVPLVVGDVITTINGRTLAALAGLELGYGKLAPGANVALTVLRQGRLIEIKFSKPDGR